MDYSSARLQRMAIYRPFFTTPSESATVHSKKNTREGEAEYLASLTYRDISQQQPVCLDIGDYGERHCCT